MQAHAGPMPPLSRLDADGVLRSLPPAALRGAALSWSSEGLRLLHVRAEPQELHRGRLVNHVVALNLGAEASWDTWFDDDGWRRHRTPHHGLCVFPALVPHAVRIHEPRDYLVVEISPAFVRSALEGALATRELRPIVGAQDEFATHVLLALAGEARRGTGGAAALRAESLGTALVSHLLDREPEPRAAPVAALSSPRLRRVLDHVAAHLDAPLTLRTLAGLAEMDVFRFVRAFKQSTGVSPHRYVLHARIALAKELLRDRTLSITEIALRTGFATPSHFSVTFRRIASASPRAFRDGLDR